MGRKPIPLASRAEVARDQRFVLMLSKREREKYDQASARLGYAATSEMIRAAVEKLISEHR